MLKPHETAFEKLVRIVGKRTQAELARRVTEANPERPVTRQAIGGWEKQIPADRVMLLVQLSRDAGEEVSAAEQRPDIFDVPRVGRPKPRAGAPVGAA